MRHQDMGMHLARPWARPARIAIAIAIAPMLGCGTNSTELPDASRDASGGTAEAAPDASDEDGDTAATGAGDSGALESRPDAAGNDAGDGATPPQPQWFYAGADIGWPLREEAIPGRVFYDFDGKTVRDPFDVLQGAGINALRVETFITDCVGPSGPFDNTGDVLGRELTYQLDNGCIDVQVKTARLGKDRGMKVVLTLNMGFDIPPAWQSYSYAQMLGAIDGEVHRQLQPFLAAGIQPDIILLENEGTDGILFNVTLPGGTVHVRGANDGNVSTAEWQKEVCGQVPTGNMASYPQLAGYYKQEIASSQAAITQAGFDARYTRFGLHSHGQYVDWKQSVVYSTDPTNETVYDANGVMCDFKGVIPDAILNERADQLLDIMGFSAYPDPMTPADPGSTTSQQATLERLNTTLGLMDDVVKRYGRVTSGPFAGQWQKQGLAVEYGTGFTYPDQIADEQSMTTLFFQALQSRDWFLGALWWEPTYCYNDWEGGSATLYHPISSVASQTGEAPTDTLRTWGSYARSPR